MEMITCGKIKASERHLATISEISEHLRCTRDVRTFQTIIESYREENRITKFILAQFNGNVI